MKENPYAPPTAAVAGVEQGIPDNSSPLFAVGTVKVFVMSLCALGIYQLYWMYRQWLKRRREWFTRMADAFMVLWWVPAGPEPTVAEAVARLQLLRERGASLEAFTFARVFVAPDADRPGEGFSLLETCPA